VLTINRLAEVQQSDPLTRAGDWTQQLAATVTVRLDATGAGTAYSGPVNVREYWEITQASVSASTNVNEALCTLSLGIGPNPVESLGTTRSGSSGDTNTFGGTILDVGYTLIAQWSVGDALAYGILKLYGVRRRYGRS